eukprot:m.70777 g.70777  ORF g.70777 m.70777 type:complete len:71 (-) comp14176_c0_seq3:111-323(-)
MPLDQLFPLVTSAASLAFVALLPCNRACSGSRILTLPRSFDLPALFECLLTSQHASSSIPLTALSLLFSL